MATNYLYGGFTRDFVALLPLGELARINKNLDVLNVIKIIRIRILNYYFSNSFLMPLVNSCITSKQKRNLMDEDKREDYLNDHIYISEKIYVSNTVKILKLGFQIFLLAYYVGAYWYVFVQFFLNYEYRDYNDL